MIDVLTRIGKSIFSHHQLKQAYHKVFNPNHRIVGIKEWIPYLILTLAKKFGNLQKLQSEYLTSFVLAPANGPPQSLYDISYLQLRLNRIYDLPDVVVSSDRIQSINVLVPAFDFKSMSAGFFGVFQVALFLKRTGLNIRLVLFDNFYFNVSEFREKFKNYPGMEALFDELEVDYIGERLKPLKVHKRDICVATVWYSAYFAEKIRVATGGEKFIYLIQDYEAHFFAANSQHVLADRSYQFNYLALFSTESLMRFFLDRDIGGITARKLAVTHFDNASAASLPSKSHFMLTHKLKPKRKLVFYSRPVVDRNMFELTALALATAYHQGVIKPDEWECIGMGLGEGRLQLLPNVQSFTLPRMSLAEYSATLPAFDVCLTLMASPHPSLIPMDLAGSGAVVVTNTFYTKTKEYLRDISKNIVPAEPSLPELVEAISRAIELSSDLETRYDNAKEMTYPRSWAHSLNETHLDFIAESFGIARNE